MSEERRQTNGEPAAAAPAGGRPDIAERVLGYFQRNAQAMDSVDGIARFWVHEDRSVVERCLHDLHAHGLLHKRTIAGTDFYSLPERASRPAADAAASRDPRTGTHGGQGATHGRVLVVDDDEAVRKFITAALTDAGHSVAAAEDGDRALAMFRDEPFDLVVTDVKMPGMSGLQLLDEIKRHNPATEVIVVTAYATLDTAVKALRIGAYDLITKPLDDIEALFRVASRALEKRRLSAENRLLVQNLQARNVELKETVARLVAQHLKARRVSVLISEPGSDTMALVASVGITEEQALASRVKVGQGIAGQVAASQRPLLVEDIAKTPLQKIS